MIPSPASILSRLAYVITRIEEIDRRIASAAYLPEGGRKDFLQAMKRQKKRLMAECLLLRGSLDPASIPSPPQA